MRTYTINSYVSGQPWVKMWSTVPSAAVPAPVPPTPPTPTYLISGTVSEDGTGFSTPLEITGLGTLFSATSGSYGFVVASGYSGTTLPHKSGGTFAPESRSYVSVATDYPNQDFVFYGTGTVPVPPVALYLISGTTTDARFGGTGFSVPLEVSGLGTIFSATSGSYGVSVVSGYSGSFIPHLSGGSFVPESRSYVSIGSNYTGQDYVFYGTGSGSTPYVPSQVLILPDDATSGLYSVLDGGVTQSPSLFVVADGLGRMFTSTDALIWTSTGTTAGFPGCLAYGAGLFVVGRLDGGIEISSDTLNWAVQTSPTADTFNALIYAGSQFVGAGFNGMVVTSADGTNWNLTSTGGADSVKSLAYAIGTYVAVGDNNTVYTSADGTAWSAAVIPSFPLDNIQAVTYSPDFNRFYAAAETFFIESADTVTWVDISGSLVDSIRGLAAGNGTVIAACFSGTAYSTADGTNWSKEAVDDGSTGYGSLFEATFCSPTTFIVCQMTAPT